MELIKSPTTFELPATEIVRQGVDRGIRTSAFYGKEPMSTCVAQVDFLGFSNLLMDAHGRAAEVVHDFYQITELHARVGARTDGDDDEPTIAIFQYADTINIVARDDGAVGIRPVILASAHLLASLHGRGLPARAGITMGEVWVLSRQESGGLDGDFVSGPAIARAHAVECAQDWAGGIIDPECHALLDSAEVTRLEKEGWIVPWDVTLRAWLNSVECPVMAINWARALHVPTDDWLPAVLLCENLSDADDEGPWRKRRAACDFYGQHGLGRLHEHEEDSIAWLMSPSGRHLPLVPAVTVYGSARQRS